MIAPLLLVAGFVGIVAAQTNSSSYSSVYTVSASSIDSTTRSTWCVSQRTSCLDICPSERASANTCDATDLSWSCVCSIGTTPNISSYEQTIPFFLCEAWQAQCQVQNTNDAAVQLACSAVVCATNNPTVASTNTSSSSSSSSSAAASSTAKSSGSTSASASATGSAASTAASATKTAAAAALEFSKSYGTGILGAGILALFGLAL